MRIDALTPREIECAEKVADGMSNRGIASELHISKNGVRIHLTHVMQKTDTRCRVELARNWNCELFQIGMRELGILRH